MWQGDSGSGFKVELPVDDATGRKSDDDDDRDTSNPTRSYRSFSFSPSPPPNFPSNIRPEAAEDFSVPVVLGLQGLSSSSSDDRSEDQPADHASDIGFATYESEGLDTVLITPIEQQRRMIGILGDEEAIQKSPVKEPKSPDTSTYGQEAIEMKAAGFFPKSLAVRNRSATEALDTKTWQMGDPSNDPSWHLRMQKWRGHEWVPISFVKAMHEAFMAFKMKAEKARLNRATEESKNKEYWEGEIHRRDKEIERLRKKLILRRETSLDYDSGLGSKSSGSTPQKSGGIGSAISTLWSQRQGIKSRMFAVPVTKSKEYDPSETERVLTTAKERRAELKQIILETRLETCELALQPKTFDIGVAEKSIKRAIKTAKEYDNACLDSEAGYDPSLSEILAGRTQYWYGRVMFANEAWYKMAPEGFKNARKALHGSSTREEEFVEQWLERAIERCKI